LEESFQNFWILPLHPQLLDVFYFRQIQFPGTKGSRQMASKRATRRRFQREERLERERLESGEDRMERFTGNVGRTGAVGAGSSVAELILARTNLLNQQKKMSIQTAQPSTSIPPIEPATAAGVEAPDSLIASTRHKELIFDDARRNQTYYLQKQNEAKQRGQWRPWFHFTKKEMQHSEFVMLTTEMAQELLNAIWTEVDGNRRLKTTLKEAYRRDIENERWIPSDESIGIDYNHVVYNGRHRLTALIESGKEWPFYISFNCLEEAKFTVDSGSKRNSSEKLRMVIDAKLGNRTIGFCKAIMRGIQPRFRYTETEIAEFAAKWQDLILWIGEHLSTGRAEVQAAIAKAYLYYGPEKIEPFCQRLREVKFTEDGDPARALFFALQRSKDNRTHIDLVAYKKALQAVYCLDIGKTLSRVTEREEDIFQWQEGWELPTGAWAKTNKIVIPAK
jgi:hypothetical protein